MVALTYDVRTVHIPVPRLALRAGSPHPTRLPAARVVPDPHWVRTERAAADRRREAHRSAALAVRSGAGY